MENILLDQVLQQVQNKEITIEKARELICVLFDVGSSVPNIDDFIYWYTPSAYKKDGKITDKKWVEDEDDLIFVIVRDYLSKFK